jgi:hypothetical protein
MNISDSMNDKITWLKIICDIYFLNAITLTFGQILLFAVSPIIGAVCMALASINGEGLYILLAGLCVWVHIGAKKLMDGVKPMTRMVVNGYIRQAKKENIESLYLIFEKKTNLFAVQHGDMCVGKHQQDNAIELIEFAKSLNIKGYKGRLQSSVTDKVDLEVQSFDLIK